MDDNLEERENKFKCKTSKWIGGKLRIQMGESMVKYAKKNSHTCSHGHICGINMKATIQNFLNFHYETMVHSIEFMVNYT